MVECCGLMSFEGWCVISIVGQSTKRISLLMCTNKTYEMNIYSVLSMLLGVV